jgi:hypothetical protein
MIERLSVNYLSSIDTNVGVKLTTSGSACRDCSATSLGPLLSTTTSCTLMAPTEPPALTRTFPPLYRSQGNTAADRLAFFHILERLKARSHLDSTGSIPKQFTADSKENGMGR